MQHSLLSVPEFLRDYYLLGRVANGLLFFYRRPAPLALHDMPRMAGRTAPT